MSVMTIDMNDDYIKDVKQLQTIVQATGGMKFTVKDSREKKYEWIGRTLGRFRYAYLSKKDKGIVKTYIAFVTHYSDIQIDRFIREKKEYGTIKIK